MGGAVVGSFVDGAVGFVVVKVVNMKVIGRKRKARLGVTAVKFVSEGVEVNGASKVNFMVIVAAEGQVKLGHVASHLCRFCFNGAGTIGVI